MMPKNVKNRNWGEKAKNNGRRGKRACGNVNQWAMGEKPKKEMEPYGAKAKR